MNVLTTGRLGKEFYNHYQLNDFGMAVKFVDNLRQEDIDWADALASFPPKDNIDLSGLTWIHSFSAGVESYLHDYQLNEKVMLSRTVGDLGYKMGEYCLSHLLNFSQNFYDVRHNQSLKKWAQLPTKSVIGSIVLIMGTGKMAQGISKVLRTMQVKTIGVNRSGNHHQQFYQCLKFDEISSIAKDVNFVINTLPHTQHTKGLLSKSFFNLFKDVLFINVGRGLTLDVSDLEMALNNDNCAYAVLDVFEEEPLSGSSSLWHNDKIIITPHQSAITDLHDVIVSFESVYQSIKANERHELIVDPRRGY